MEPRANISKENHNRPRDLITKDKLSYSSLDDINPRAFLTRAQAAEALEACGVKVSQATLASKATLGGGPKFRRFGKSAVYLWADVVAWVHETMSEPAPTASEHRTNAGEASR